MYAADPTKSEFHVLKEINAAPKDQGIIAGGVKAGLPISHQANQLLDGANRPAEEGKQEDVIGDLPIKTESGNNDPRASYTKPMALNASERFTSVISNPLEKSSDGASDNEIKEVNEEEDGDIAIGIDAEDK